MRSTPNAWFGDKVEPNADSRRGWRDYVNGRPFRREYDRWDEIKQRDYERGRLRAAGARLAGFQTVPLREPRDIVQRTNGLRLVPRDATKRRQRRIRLRAPAEA